MTDRPTNHTDRPELRPAAPKPESVNGHTPDPTNPQPTRLGRLLAPNRPADRKEATMPTTAPTAAPTAIPTDRTDRADGAEPKTPGRLAQWREGRAAKATARKQEATDRARRQQEATDRARQAAAVAAQRQATESRPTSSEPTGSDIAPVPDWLTWFGVWADRTFGALPLAAPLVVSGAYTMQVFTGDVIKAHPAIALLAAVALEGGLWKLSRLYEKTLVAGDSTMGLRAGISVYIALISGLIYWNAGHTAKAEGRTELGEDALPAFGVAIMCAFGVYIWSRTARWQRRRELHAAGRIDAQAPKFAALAWILCPVETPKALRHAVKYRIQSPTTAVEDLRLFKAAGRPSVWPPVAPTTVSADRPTTAPTAPAVATAPKPTAAPTAAPIRLATVAPTPTPTPTVAPTTTASTQPTVATRPTAPKPTVPAARPAVQSTVAPTNGDRPTYTTAAVENAAVIRARFGTTDRLKLADVRNAFEPRWSYDKANPAFKAYLAGADLPTDQEDAEGARPLAHTN